MVFCFIVGATSTIANADEPPPGAPVDRAVELYRQANALYDQKKLAEAESRYLEAWALRPTWDIATNLAACELDMGKYRDAAKYFSFALRNFPARGKAEEQKVLETRLALAKEKVVTLHVAVNVDKADISVNGKLTGASPLQEELFADSGSITVGVARDGYASAQQVVHGLAGERKELTFLLVRKDEGDAPPRNPVPGYVAGGIGIAALGVGAALLGLAESTRSDLDRKIPRDADGKLLCYQYPRPDGTDTGPECAALRRQGADVATFGNTGIALLVTGGAVVAGAALYLLLPSVKTSRTSVSHVVPMFGREGGGLMWTGAF